LTISDQISSGVRSAPTRLEINFLKHIFIPSGEYRKKNDFRPERISVQMGVKIHPNKRGSANSDQTSSISSVVVGGKKTEAKMLIDSIPRIMYSEWTVENPILARKV